MAEHEWTGQIILNELTHNVLTVILNESMLVWNNAILLQHQSN